MRTAVSLVLLGVLLGAPHTAAETRTLFGGGGHDASKPIEVEADSFDADLDAETAVYEGNVRVTQGDLKMRANRVTIRAAEGAAQRIEAAGGVVLTSPSGSAESALGVYDLAARTVTLSGGVTLTQAGNVMSGGQLVVNLDTGVANLSAGENDDGRVRGLFKPPSQQTPGR